MAQAECGGVKTGRLYNISADGRCMYNSVLTSLRLHPCGNLIALKGLPATVQDLLQRIFAHPSWAQYWTLLYEPIRGRDKRDEGDPDWAFTFLRDKTKTLEDFLARARYFVSNPGMGLGHDAWGGDGEFTAISNILEESAVDIVRFNSSGIPSSANFGTLVNPTIHVVYNGSHYDSYTHTPASGLPASSAKVALATPPPRPRFGMSLPSIGPARNPPVSQVQPAEIAVNISSENVGNQEAILKNIQERAKVQWKCGVCDLMNPSNKKRCERCTFNKQGGRRKTKKSRKSKKRLLKRKTKKHA